MIDLRTFRESRNLNARDMVDVVRQDYPGYDRSLQSKAENPDYYGVRLVAGAEKLLEESFTKTAPETKKRDRHRMPRRIQCRMTQAKFAVLQLKFQDDGFETMQEGIAHLIDKYLEED